jgi:hypothetical protein
MITQEMHKIKEAHTSTSYTKYVRNETSSEDLVFPLHVKPLTKKTLKTSLKHYHESNIISLL